MALKRSKDLAYWCDQIAIYEREFKKWENRAKKIAKRYKDERNDSENTKARFNILWSNVQTLQPALYAKNPIPNVDRRFEDEDKVGTTAARVLERSVTYFVDNDLFGNVMSQCVLDRLLPGRGVSWVRYNLEGGEVTEDIETESYVEDVVIDYVHWQDFLHGWGRTWEEVPWVGRKVYMDRDALKKRFKNGSKIPLDKEDKNDEEKVGGPKKACIYEIWDKNNRKALWLHKGMEEILDERPDPLGLHDFFPCPKPIYSTLANDNLIPSPDYTQYQDQARELDELTGRINSITKALKVVGVYDKAAEGVSRILSEGLENTMVPVEQWAIFGEKGGLKGVVDWFPMEMVVNTLISLYDAREKVKQDLYEITGISDIIRGATDPNETASAQKIKGQFATLRLDSMQRDVARFSRDLVRIMAEIIAEHFSIETIKQICGIRLLTQAEKQQLMLTQTPTAPGVPPPPLPEDTQELLDNPTWEEVEALLRDDTLRCFRISIETDSTIKSDQEAEKQARVELLTAVGGFLQQAVGLPPQLQPLAAELLMFGVRGFKVSREIETTFDLTMKKIKQASDAPPQPDPEMQKMQAQSQADQQKAQMEAQKFQAEQQAAQQDRQAQAQVDLAKNAAEMEKIKLEATVAQQQAAFDLQKMEIQMGIEKIRLQIAQASLKNKENPKEANA